MKLASLNRWKASLAHLAISAAIGVAVVTLMLVVWYPRPYFKAMGGDVLILLLIGVDVVIGPLITLIIFDPGKGAQVRPERDRALQLAALAYGCHVMFGAPGVQRVRGRPVRDGRRQSDRCGVAIESDVRQFKSLPLPAEGSAGARQPGGPAAQGRHHPPGDEWRP